MLEVDKNMPRRILMYSHDTFGLGHLRRCRALAHAIVDRYKSVSVLILTGSPIIGSFSFKARVDFVRIPGVIKLHNGQYTSLSLLQDLSQTLALRESIIRHTAELFDPDLFIVDKEPLGLKGEIEPTLSMLKQKGVPMVLGVRDVLDAPHLLRVEWEEKRAIEAIKTYYRQVWVYGDPSMGNPLDGVAGSEEVGDRVVYTGYLRRSLPETYSSQILQQLKEPYILVTPGGGGDGIAMVDAVLRAYEQCLDLPLDVLIVLGPFMPKDVQDNFQKRAAVHSNVRMIMFDNCMEALMQRAEAVVAMAGYNTFCEILSFDKPALLLPRKEPRQEQWLRALKAQELGLVTAIDLSEKELDRLLSEALKTLHLKPKPSSRLTPHFLGGLDTVRDQVADLIGLGEEDNNA
ncbi:membrane protein [Marinobacterium zhoushanense]|uniref:Membrane protein n=1 Tax=Marinobacterium zhoushanense TaxID=1679163 RepID=A0ABQ1KGQ9_9GAMM|nr:glycosyltransferase [Marinobacterium zhoushanense]GGB95106.1 membrane protein [Marinobacterium zhoushanense]